jgi:ferritin-like metal-binding protein YciE
VIRLAGTSFAVAMSAEEHMAKKRALNETKLTDLLYQALETELGGVQVYTKALECAVNEELREEWTRYLEETKTHVQRLQEVCMNMGLDPNEKTPSRKVVKHIGESLVKAMEMAQSAGDPDAAQLVACECVVHAETKDHLNWELIGLCLEKGQIENSEMLQEAYDEIEDQEDEHLYHTKGWCRELAIEGLGLPAVLPPPEEEKDVKTAIGAARAEQSRDQMLSKAKH